jgi:hypothetical protein
LDSLIARKAVLEQDMERFRNELRRKLANVDGVLEHLKSKIETNRQQAEDAVRVYLAKVRIAIDHNRAKLAAAEAQMSQWVEARTTTPSEAVAVWKRKHELSKLQDRALLAERNAAAAREIAMAALDDAEEAALEAWLARRDANSLIRRV